MESSNIAANQNSYLLTIISIFTKIIGTVSYAVLISTLANTVSFIVGIFALINFYQIYRERKLKNKTKAK